MKPSPPTRRRRRSAARQAASGRNQPPGSAGYTGDGREHSVAVTVLDYGPDVLQEHAAASMQDLAAGRESSTVTWVNVDGIHDVDTVRAVCEAFGVHPLVVEDLLNPGSRPKVEDYGDVVFVVAKMIRPGPTPTTLEVEQVAVLLGSSWVLSFQERPGDGFEAIRKRVRAGTGRIRRMGADYLLHAILDALVDATFVVLEVFDEAILELDAQAFDGADGELVRHVHTTRGALGSLRRLVWPMREVTTELLRSEGSRIRADSLPFYRDLNDHVVQSVELIDSYRDRLTSTLELHLALVSNKMNDVMKLLTIVSTLFIPLTFIAGIYGMNFAGMPELHWRWGYPVVLVVMGGITLALLGYFRRRRWL